MNRLDTLHVRNYKADKDQGERVIVDFDEDQTTDRFLVMTAEGGMLCVGHERVWMEWNALVQLADLIKHGAKTIRRKNTPTPLG